MDDRSNKSKKKKKVRKLTFLRGKDDTESMDKVKPVENQEFAKFFKDLIKQHPEYVINHDYVSSKGKDQKKGGDKAEEEMKERIGSPKCSNNPLKSELIIGLKVIMLKIQRKEVIGVILTDPLTIHLQATIYDLCREFGVAFLLVSNLHQLDEILGISKLTSLAFTEKVTQPTSTLYNLYKIFLKYAKKFDQGSVSTIDPCLSIKPAKNLEKEIKEEVSDEPPETLFKFTMPAEEQFYLPRETSDDVVSIKRDLGSQQSKNSQEFIAINNEEGDFFPQRFYFHQFNVNLSWGVKDKDVKKSIGLGKKLFISDEIEEKLKEERANQAQFKEERANQAQFKEPKIAQLPCSGKDKKRFRNMRKKSLKS